MPRGQSGRSPVLRLCLHHALPDALYKTAHSGKALVV